MPELSSDIHTHLNSVFPDAALVQVALPTTSCRASLSPRLHPPNQPCFCSCLNQGGLFSPRLQQHEHIYLLLAVLSTLNPTTAAATGPSSVFEWGWGLGVPAGQHSPAASQGEGRGRGATWTMGPMEEGRPFLSASSHLHSVLYNHPLAPIHLQILSHL